MDLDPVQSPDGAGHSEVSQRLEPPSTLSPHDRVLSQNEDEDTHSVASSELSDLPDTYQVQGTDNTDAVNAQDQISAQESVSSGKKNRGLKRELDDDQEVDELDSAADDEGAKTDKKPSKPAKKKAKTSKSIGHTSKDKENRKQKKGKKKRDKGKSQRANKAKEKGKKKKEAVDSDSEEDEQEEEHGTKKKKGLVAKAVEWQDIPDWGDRTDCPLLQLPVEVLDLCFGLDSGLRTRDYLALAGVSRYFRDKFTPAVFHEIYYHTSQYDSASWHKRKVKYTKVKEPERTGQANRIFSRSATSKYSPPPMKIYRYATPKHYIPSGPRQEWSGPQYTIYKEEQAKWRKQQRRVALEAQKKATADKNGSHSSKRWCLEHEGRNRRIVGMVEGLKDGESPTSDTQLTEPAATAENEDGSKEEHETDHEEEDTTPSNQQTGRKWNQKSKNRRWMVPETDDEQEIRLEPLKRDPKTGEKIIHDYWPNSWRRAAADGLWHSRISKSTAMTTYKVTEAQLLCLSHVLIPNSMGGKHPQHMYMTAAVEALAFRAHGGPLGHQAYLNQSKIKADKAAKARKDKIIKAKADGTFVKKFKKHHFPLWAQWEWDDYGEFCGKHCPCRGWDQEKDSLVYDSYPSHTHPWWVSY
ncbi:hypothetical protein IAT40_001083 [Kwoniella sp. CBS 6097]